MNGNKLNMDEVIAAAEETTEPDFAAPAGELQGGCEPDARNYQCESCGENEVFGAAELLLMYG